MESSAKAILRPADILSLVPSLRAAYPNRPLHRRETHVALEVGRLSRLAASGLDPTSWAIDKARTLVEAGQIRGAMAFGAKLATHTRFGQAGHLAAAFVAVRRGLYCQAWHHFGQVPAESCRQHLPHQWYRTWYEVAPSSATEWAAKYVSATTAQQASGILLEILRTSAVARQSALEVATLARLDEVSATGSISAPDQRTLQWARQWHPFEHDRTLEPGAARSIQFGVMGYRQPEYGTTSRNIGDYVQTLASLVHLLRFDGLTLTGQDESLVRGLTELAGHIDRSKKVVTAPTTVEVHEVGRDSSTLSALPEDTWMLVFGWHADPLYGTSVFDFPHHRNIRPIFTSFNCRRPAMLTDEMVEYLRQHAPIGCRDWTTTYNLLAAGIPAFFSGCLTTTVGALFDGIGSPPNTSRGYIDAIRAPHDAPQTKHALAQIRGRSLAQNLDDAYKLLASYKSRFTHITTSRLHCYLPARSMGIEVDFQPKNPSDMRFTGLAPLSDEDFVAMRDGHLERLQHVLGTLLETNQPSEVLATWQSVCEPLVKAAHDKFRGEAQPPSLAGATAQIPARAMSPARPTKGRHSAMTAIQVVVCAGSQELAQIDRVLASLADHAPSLAQPVQVVSDGKISPSLRRRHRAVEWVSARPHPKSVGRPLDHLWFQIPELLADTSTALILPVSALALGPFPQLHKGILDGRPIAAKTRSGQWVSGFTVLYHAASSLRMDTERSGRLYREIHQNHPRDFAAFATDAVVLDLVKARETGLTDFAERHAREYKMTKNQILQLRFGGDTAEIQPELLFDPTTDGTPQAPLWVWPNRLAPWAKDYWPSAEVWHQAPRR